MRRHLRPHIISSPAAAERLIWIKPRSRCSAKLRETLSERNELALRIRNPRARKVSNLLRTGERNIGDRAKLICGEMSTIRLDGAGEWLIVGMSCTGSQSFAEQRSGARRVAFRPPQGWSHEEKKTQGEAGCGCGSSRASVQAASPEAAAKPAAARSACRG